MARKSLKPQLNQIRAWVRQGRTDAWIAHQLDVSATDLREFRRQHDLLPEGEGDSAGEIDLRDEIEAEIEAATQEEATEGEASQEEATDGEDAKDEGKPDSGEEADGSEAEGRPRRRRRRGRRGGRGRGKSELEATFDHGERDGYGLWLDPAVQDIQAYTENWAGHRKVTVKVEPDQIVIQRSGEDGSSQGSREDDDGQGSDED